jgi:hypothetical protein
MNNYLKGDGGKQACGGLIHYRCGRYVKMGRNSESIQLNEKPKG